MFTFRHSLCAIFLTLAFSEYSQAQSMPSHPTPQMGNQLTAPAQRPPGEPASFTHNGEPYFPIAMYGSYPSNGTARTPVARHDYTQQHLGDLAASGFNLVLYTPYSLSTRPKLLRTIETTKDWIESCADVGMNVKIGTGRFMGYPKRAKGGCVFDDDGCPVVEHIWPEFRTELGELVDAIKDYDNFFCYWFVDEPEYGPALGRFCMEKFPLSLLTEVSNYIKSKDTAHPLMINQVDIVQLAGCSKDCNFAVLDHKDHSYPVTRIPLPLVSPYDFYRNMDALCARYAEWVGPGDVFTMDIYPVGHKWHDTFMSLNAPTYGFVRQRDDILAKKNNPPQGMYIQSYLNGIIPKYVEARFMAFDPITEGAKGVFWYGGSAQYKADPASARWKGIEDVTAELSVLQDVLAAGITISKDQYAVPENLHAICKQYPAGTGPRYLIVTNPSKKPQNDVRISMGSGAGIIRAMFEGQTPRSARTIDAGSGTFTDHFEPWAVHIYTTDTCHWRPPKPRDARAISSTVEPGDSVTLKANAINGAVVHWYQDDGWKLVHKGDTYTFAAPPKPGEYGYHAFAVATNHDTSFSWAGDPVTVTVSE